MITIEQSRAARGLLGWTQQDLADAAGLSKTAINNFEKSKSVIKIDSINAIKTAFEGQGVEFINDNGVRLAQDSTEILSGDLALRLLVEDIKSVIDNAKHKDIMVLCAHEHHIEMLAPLHSVQTPVRFLCGCDIDIDDSLAQAQKKQCRQIAGQNAENSPTVFIYAQKTAIQLFGDSQIVLMKNADAYTAERKRFELLWQKHSPHSCINNVDIQTKA